MPQPFFLKNSLRYQEGSIVSKEIFKNEYGTITVFAFDEGQGLSEHKTPYDAMVYVVDGSVEITISGVRHLLKKGEVILMPADHPHAVKAISRFKMLLVMMKK